MVVQALTRWGALVAMATLVAGCSAGGDSRSNECRWNRSACMYEGAYEPDEEAYAEEEAQRLNRDAARRVRRW